MLRKALSLKRFPYKSGCACSEKWGRPSTFALLFTRLGGHAPKSWTAAGLARAFFIRFYRFLGGYTPKKHWIFSRETGWSCSEFCNILANNAGISQNTPLFDYKDEDFDKILDLNIKALYSCSRAAAEIMKEQGGGVIINTSSIVSFNGQGSGCGYPTSKFAVNGLTKSLSRELGRYNIRVNAVAPGVTRTDMVAVLPDEMIKPIIKNIPLGRMAEPEDIANAFLFLASDLASYISGAILPVAGAVVI